MSSGLRPKGYFSFHLWATEQGSNGKQCLSQCGNLPSALEAAQQSGRKVCVGLGVRVFIFVEIELGPDDAC